MTEMSQRQRVGGGGISRRGLLGAGLGGGLALAGCASAQGQVGVTGGLAQAARTRGMLFGAMTAARSLRDDAFVALLRAQCDVIGPLNAFKWHVMEAGGEEPDYSATDAFVANARAWGLRVRGHALVWDKAPFTPPWLLRGAARSPAAMEAVVRRRVTSLCSRYRGKVSIWDVVNEARNLGGRPQNGPVAKVLGDGFMDIAFDAARQSDSAASLLYTDYVAPQYPKMQDGIYDMLSGFRQRGVPCDGLGIQGHVSRDASDSEYRRWRDFVAAVSGLGLSVMITELDLTDTALPRAVSPRDAHGAEMVARFLDATLADGAVSAVMAWSLSDRYEGLSYYRPRADGTRRRPTPFDTDLKPKPMYEAIRQALLGAPMR